MDIFAGIDGTGISDNQRYAEEFKDSFVNRIARHWHTPAKIYRRGPTWHGHETAGIAESVFANVLQARTIAGGSNHRITVAGYSRGGLAAIRVCERLQRKGIEVGCLLLFDAVDMALGIDGDIVPGNVESCFHARRSPLSHSRSSWGNCGTKRQGATLYRERLFLCTHGGMGGVPWTTCDETSFINEALTAPTEMTTRLHGMVNPLIVLPIIMNDLHQSASRTAITIAQDRTGSNEVRQWMFAALNASRSVSDVPAI